MKTTHTPAFVWHFGGQAILLAAALALLMAFAAAVAHAADPLSSWNDGPAKKRVFAFDEAGGGASSSRNSLIGIKWRVAELSGHPVATSLQEEQPFIMFDAAKQQAAGYAGCNRFFGGYSLEGAALKFGPIGATKRACPDLDESIEREFFKALDATQSWQIVEGALQFMNNDRVLARLQKIQGP